jgi:hypothetical protein
LPPAAIQDCLDGTIELPVAILNKAAHPIPAIATTISNSIRVNPLEFITV